MKKAVLILAIVIFSILYYMGVMTRKETLPFSKEFFSVETPPTVGLPMDVKGVWPLKGRTPGQKVPTLSSKELDQLYQMKLDRGLRNLPVISFYLIREAEQARRGGDHDLSVRLATFSIKFSPDLSQPYFELAKARLYQNPFQVGQGPSQLFRRAECPQVLFLKRPQFLLQPVLYLGQCDPPYVYALWNYRSGQVFSPLRL